MKFDCIVIGGGAAGFTVSKTLAGMGKKVAIIEKNKLGGECTHFGCVPSKALIKAASICYNTKKLSKFGLSEIGEVDINTDNVMDYVKKIVEQVYQGHTPDVFEKSGIKVYTGSPEFIDSNTVKVNNKNLTAKKFVICTGSSAFIPPIEGVDKVRYLDNEKFFKLETLPKSILILGAGPIGIELAQALNRLKVKVTVVEMMDRILFREEKEESLMLQEILGKEGVNILCSAKAVKLDEKDDKINLTVEIGEDKRILTSDEILIAVGRKPNLEGLNLEKAGIKYDRKGIIVDEYLRTTNENIYACGDVVPPYQFSHISEYEGVLAAINIVSPIKKKRDYSNVIWTSFTDPEFSHLGLTEEQAIKKYGKENINIYKEGYSSLDRAKTDSATIGSAKFILYKNKKLIGASILGSRAGDIIHSAQILKTLDIPFYKIKDCIHSYPCYADIVRQSGKKNYINILENNFFIKILKKIF